jgi:hypothetical protein
MALEMLPSAEDVIAFRIEGKLEHEALEHLLEIVERSISSREKTHMFVEAVGFSGLEVKHLLEYLRRGLPLLGKLKRFGRIAVVSDQAWLRAAARMESALLPNISYETFEPSDRERALAWVEGRESRPHGAGIRIVETGRLDVLAFEIDGRLTRQDLEAVAERFTTGPRRVLGKITRLGGAEIAGLVDEDLVKMKLAALSSVERYAIVGGPPWLAGWVSFIDAIAKAEIRHFRLEDEEAAWEWLGASPRSGDTGPAAPI